MPDKGCVVGSRFSQLRSGCSRHDGSVERIRQCRFSCIDTERDGRDNSRLIYVRKFDPLELPAERERMTSLYPRQGIGEIMSRRRARTVGVARVRRRDTRSVDTQRESAGIVEISGGNTRTEFRPTLRSRIPKFVYKICREIRS